MDFGFFLLLFVVPWLISTKLKEVFNTTKNCFMGIVVVALVLAWLTDVLRRRELRIPKGPVLPLLTMAMIWSAITIAWSIAPSLSVREYSYQLALYFVFVLAFLNISEKDRIENLIHFSIAAGVVTGGFGLLQYYGLDTVVFPRLSRVVHLLLPDFLANAIDPKVLVLPQKPEEHFKIYSTMGHRNYMAGYLIAVIPLVLSRLVAALDQLGRAKEVLRQTWHEIRKEGYLSPPAFRFLLMFRSLVVYSASLAVMFWAVVLTQTRGGWSGGLIGVSFFFLVLYLRFPRMSSWRRLRVPLGLMLFILILLFPSRIGIGSYSFKNPLQKSNVTNAKRLMYTVEVNHGSAHQRLLIYRTALWIIFDNPWHFLFGTGYGTFGMQYMPHQKFIVDEEFPRPWPQDWIDRVFEIVFFKGHRGTKHWHREINKSIYAHNEILHFWSEIGLVGMGLLLAMLLAFWMRALKHLLHGTSYQSTFLDLAGLFFLHLLVLVLVVGLFAIYLGWGTPSKFIVRLVLWGCVLAVFIPLARFMRGRWTATTADHHGVLYLGMLSAIMSVLGHQLFTFDLHLSYTAILFWTLLAFSLRFAIHEEWVLTWRPSTMLPCRVLDVPSRLVVAESDRGNVEGRAMVPFGDIAEAPEGVEDLILRLEAPSGKTQEKPVVWGESTLVSRPYEEGVWVLRLLSGDQTLEREVLTVRRPTAWARPLILSSLTLVGFLVVKQTLAVAFMENAWRDGFLKFRMKQFEESFLDYRRATSYVRNRGEVLFDYGRALMDSNRNGVAIKAFTQAVKTFVDPANFHNMALCYYKEWQAALRKQQELVKKGDQAAAADWARRAAENHRMAEEMYRKAIDLNMIYEQSLSNLAFLLMDRSNKLKAQGKKEQADRDLDEAIMLLERGHKYYGSKNTQFASTLGAIHAQNARYDDAARMFEEALYIGRGEYRRLRKKKQPKVWLNYATVLYNQKRYEDALVAIKKARDDYGKPSGHEKNLLVQKYVSILKANYKDKLEKPPVDTKDVRGYAEELMSIGLFKDAADVFRQLLEKIDPNDVDARLALGKCYHNLKQFDAARKEYEQLKSRLTPADDNYKAVESALRLLSIEMKK